MRRHALLVLDCSDDCLRALSDIAPQSFGSLHLLTKPAMLLRLASRCDAPVVILPLDDDGTATLLLIQHLIRGSPAARIALFVRPETPMGSYVAEAIRAGAAEVLLDGEDWTRIFARLQRRPRPVRDRA